MISFRRTFAKAAIVGCAITGLAWQACAASPEGMKLYIFTSQPLDIAKSALSSAATGDEKILIPVAFFLIKHPKGNIMFDTGDNDKIITDKTYWGPMAAMLDKGVNPDLAIDVQLGKIGIKVNVQTLDSNTYVQKWLGADFEAAIAQNSGSVDPNTMYARYFTAGSTFSKGAGYRSPALDKLFAQGAHQRKAAAICRRCPVMRQCGAEALDHRVEFGVWGGMTERERRAILKKNPGVVSWAEFLARREAANAG